MLKNSGFTRDKLLLRMQRLSYVGVAFVIFLGLFIAIPFAFFPEKAEAAISFRSSTTNSSNPCSSGLAINKPAGVTVGDVMIAQVASDGGALSTPSGWATIDSGSYHTNTIRMATFFRIIEGGEGSSFSFPVGTSTSCRGAILAFEGVDNGQVVDNSGLARTTNSGTGTTVTAASITTIPSTNTMIVTSMYKANGAASANFSTISGMTEGYDLGATEGAIAGDYATQASSGASGAKTSTISSANWVAHMVALKPATVHMMLFWDGGGSAPAGWSYVTAAEGYYPRGSSVANYGTTGGQANHTHDNPSIGISGPSAQVSAGTNNISSPTAHAHSLAGLSAPVDTLTNEPTGYKLRLIRFNSGVPNIIPANAIAIFDGDPGMPNDGNWTQLSAADNRVIKVDSTVGNGPGSDTDGHSITWTGSLGNATGTTTRTCAIILCNSNHGSTATHNHANPSGTTLQTTSKIPPYFRPVLGKVSTATPTLSLGLTAMFDGEPGGGWIVKSDVGGDYYRRFIRPAATFGQSATPSNLCAPDGFGCVGHDIPDTVFTTGTATGGNVNNNLAGSGIAAAGHTHNLTLSWPAYTSDSHYTGNNEYFLPPYFSVVIAEKVNFILDAYRWYEDTNDENVTDPWSILDVPQSQPIPTLPVAYNPPIIGTELRLRVRIAVNNNDLAAGEMQFKLQYKEGDDGLCTTGVWTDLDAAGGGGIWRYATSGENDGEPLSQARLSSDVLQRYARSSSPGTNPNPVDAPQTMEWDFHIEHNGAPGATQYSFRLAEDSGILLSEYAACPTLSARPTAENQLRHGNFFESGTERGYSWN